MFACFHYGRHRADLSQTLYSQGVANLGPIAVHIVIGAQNFMPESRGHFVCLHSARGLAHSKTLRVFQESSCRAQRLGLRRPSAAFPRGISNCTHVNWNYYNLPQITSNIEIQAEA